MADATDRDDGDCHAGWCATTDWCAITCTMDVLGNKWHPVIVDRLLDDGPLRFGELADAMGPATNKVLSNSLEALQDAGVVRRTVLGEEPLRVEYGLTDRGRSLEPVIDALATWGEAHGREEAASGARSS